MDANAVAVKLPTFWTTSPVAWFAQAEAQFVIRNITADDTKYYYVVAALDSSTATRVVSLLVDPPEDNKYAAIKAFLTGAYELSETERATSLLGLPGLGDSLPSELMDSMLALFGSHKSCFIFRHIFLQQLPDYVRSSLASSSTTDYRTLAQEADKIYLTGRPQLQEVNIQKSKPVPTASKQSPKQTFDECYYHHRYGKKAKKCVPPCKHHAQFQGNESQGQR